MSWHDTPAPSRRRGRARILALEQAVERYEQENFTLQQQLADRELSNALLVAERQENASLIGRLQRTVREQKAELENVHRALGAAAAQSMARETKGPKGPGKKAAKGAPHVQPKGQGRASGGRELYPEHFGLQASRTQTDSTNAMTEQEPE